MNAIYKIEKIYTFCVISSLKHFNLGSPVILKA
jgi:hypothetical protein